MATTVSHTSVRATLAALNYPPAPTTPTVPVSSLTCFLLQFFCKWLLMDFYLGILMFCITVFTSPYGLYQTYFPQIKHWNYQSLLDFMVLLAVLVIESLTSQIESRNTNHCKPISHCCFNWKYLSHTLFRPSTFSYGIIMRISYKWIFVVLYKLCLLSIIFEMKVHTFNRIVL